MMQCLYRVSPQIDPALVKQSPWRWITEHVVIPALRTELTATREMADDGTLLQLADLKDLYRVFERC